MAKNKWKHALVVGASSGIGEALAKRLADSGARVALVARREGELDRIVGEINERHAEQPAMAFVHDVTKADEVPELFQTISRKLGGLDLVVYAAGLMHPVAFEEFDCSKDVPMIETNLVGAVAWLGCAAERFGRLKRGTIVGIGSVAGDRGRCANPAYHASKAGLHTYLESLRNRVSRFGVRVVTVKPGFVDTAMTRGMSGLFWLISADRAAEIILRKAKGNAKNAYVPARWRLVMWVIRSIPSVIFRRLKV
ncbi:MAG: SDR family NAD(P)-dependent oxidoreductase [bacterium]|nr:SDR family NAD(P)-dependent oxidoreductase [bacterium]